MPDEIYEEYMDFDEEPDKVYDKYIREGFPKDFFYKPMKEKQPDGCGCLIFLPILIISLVEIISHL